MTSLSSDNNLLECTLRDYQKHSSLSVVTQAKASTESMKSGLSDSKKEFSVRSERQAVSITR